MHKVCLAIGSNMGNRHKNCAEALRILNSKGINILKSSDLYETEPWGFAKQEKFINMAVYAETQFEPEDLLKILKDIEKQLGRKDSFRWGPRAIDLDIIFYDDIVMDSPLLKIPHKRAHERRFVLEPLAEICPEAVHPVLGKNVKSLLKELIYAEDSQHKKQG